MSQISVDITTLENYKSLPEKYHSIGVKAAADGFETSELSETVTYSNIVTVPYISARRLKTFATEAKAVYGLKKTAEAVRNAINTYLLNCDYENELAFDTSFIVSGDNTAVLDSARLDYMVLG